MYTNDKASDESGFHVYSVLSSDVVIWCRSWSRSPNGDIWVWSSCKRSDHALIFDLINHDLDQVWRSMIWILIP